jgi:hypothetical protein
LESTQTPPAGSSPAGGRTPAKRRRPAAKRTGKTVHRSPRKPRRVGSRRKSARSWKSLVEAISSSAAAAGSSVATASGEGLARARQALERVGDTSRKTIESLAEQWKKMDAKKRAGVLAALAAALAAASAPVVTHQIKKR